MTFIVEKCSIPGWQKKFPTKASATAELRSHICGDCLSGVFVSVSSKEPSGFARDQMRVPDPSNYRDLLSTSCGCEYEMRRI